MKKVGIIMGSDSDLPVMSKAAAFLDKIGIEYEISIVSAHRTPERMVEYAKTAKERGIAVIIAGAGGAAHLPGMTASLTALPVIGVPVESKSLKGEDSLLSIAQMPPGIPVATMAINGAENAGIMAASILGATDDEIYNKLMKYKNDLREMVEGKAEKLENDGYEKYLKSNL
ncbi:MAG: 5-(carboxyamino)imidazole ribonucleotide mutase [Methanosarcinales archaeon]|jgi:5-(carboxyamino)imidazole ribonucleotide mutase|nr:5-(carboxyamino)imidazole ribonucleotide mutase [Methanosarcinales archaeon]